MKPKSMVVASLLLLASNAVNASEWMRGVEVTRIGTYQHSTVHFIWFSAAPPTTQCTNVISFDDAVGGGKGLLAVLMAALINKRRIDVQVEGCRIVEVYLH